MPLSTRNSCPLPPGSERGTLRSPIEAQNQIFLTQLTANTKAAATIEDFASLLDQATTRLSASKRNSHRNTLLGLILNILERNLSSELKLLARIENKKGLETALNAKLQKISGSPDSAKISGIRGTTGERTSSLLLPTPQFLQEIIKWTPDT